ncbi:MAG TPA: hypothetical protein VMH87_16745 [Pseudomonadales bacterium]|nr:hypothetical protein [Pseudomonadales bacterium]
MNHAKASPKKSKLRKYTWLVVFVVPLLSFLFIKEEWKSRLVAITGYLLLINICAFIWGLNPKANFSKTRPKEGQERRWLIKERIVRILVICFAIFFLYFCTYPEVTESMGVIHNGRASLLQTEGKVQEVHFDYGMFFLYQTIVIEDKRGWRHDFSAFFFGSPAKIGTTYDFLTMPKSKIILEWDPVHT